MRLGTGSTTPGRGIRPPTQKELCHDDPEADPPPDRRCHAAPGAACYDCGTVTRIETGVGSRAPNATGAVIGGIVGAAAAREVAKDRTDSSGRQNTATVAGAAAGAAIGNAIQNRAGTGYNIYVRMQDGRETVAMQDDLGNIRVGSYVRVVNGRAYSQ